MKTRTSALAAGIAALALLFAACGGDSGGRPTAGELADEIKDSDDTDALTDEQIDCIAEAYVNSDISDEGLRTLADSGNVDDISDLDVSEDDQAAVESVVSETVDCVGDPAGAGADTVPGG